MEGWLQKHDYDADEFPALSLSKSLEILDEFDWKTEIQRADDAGPEGEGSMDCPAGLGLTHEDGRIFHIIPGLDGSALCHYHYSGDVSKLCFGLLRYEPNYLLTVERVEKSDYQTLLILHFDANHDGLVEGLKAAGVLVAHKVHPSAQSWPFR